MTAFDTLLSVLSKDTDVAPSDWHTLSTQSEAFVCAVADGLPTAPRWLHDNPQFLERDLSKIVANKLIGRTPLLKLLKNMAEIPAEDRSPSFRMKVDTVLGYLADVVFYHHPEKDSQDPVERIAKAFIHIASNRKIAEGYRDLLIKLDPGFEPIANIIRESMPVPNKAEPKPKVVIPKPPKEVIPFVKSEQRHTKKGLSILTRFPHIVSGPEREERLAELSHNAATAIPNLNLRDIEFLCKRFADNFYCANEFFKAARTVAIGCAEQLQEEPKSLSYDDRTDLVSVHSTLVNFYFSDPALNGALHNAFIKGAFDRHENHMQDLVISFASFLNDDDFSRAWNRSLRFLTANEPSRIRYVAAGALRGMEIPSHWEFRSLDPDVQNPFEILNYFESTVYHSLTRVLEKAGQATQIYPEGAVGGFTVDMCFKLGGKMIGVECDGVHFHYIHHSPQNGMLWGDYLREWYIQYHHGIPLIRIPSTHWPDDKAARDRYLEEQIRKIATIPLQPELQSPEHL